MKKLSFLLIVALSVFVGSISAGAAAAPAKTSSVYWADDEGVNATVVDGKSNATKRLYKGPVRQVAVVGDWIYFLKMDPDEEIVIGDIVKIKKDGTKLTQVTKSNKVGQFDVDGDSIYYSAYDKDNNYNLYVMKLDGTGSKKLKAKLPSWSYAVGKGGTLFYYNTDKNNALYVMKPDGTGVAAVSSNPVGTENYKPLGDVVFYAEPSEDYETFKSYLADLNGKNKVALPSKTNIKPLAYVNQWFYYLEVTYKNDVESSVLMKVKRDGKQKQTLAAVGADDRYIGQLDNGLAFMPSDPKGKVYQIGFDGKVAKPTGK